MSDDEVTQQAPAKPRRYFRSKSSQPQISPEAAAREGSILRIAVAALGVQGAQTFLNEPNDELDGQPLAIAANSADGYEAVAAAIAAVTPPSPATGV